MSKRKAALPKGSNEFYSPGESRKEDAHLHEVLLRDADGAALADLEAVAAAVLRGVPLEKAIKFYAGGAARMLLRRAELL